MIIEFFKVKQVLFYLFIWFHPAVQYCLYTYTIYENK